MPGTVAAVHFARPAPGFWSSPCLAAASIYFLVKIRKGNKSRTGLLVAPHFFLLTNFNAVCVSENFTTFTSTSPAALPAANTCDSLISCLPLG